MKLRALSFAVVACVCLSPHRSVMAQGIPCSYEVAHVIQAPDGPINASPTVATAISPNGRYVVGWFRFDAVGQDRAFVYDTQSEVFQALPLPPGIVVSRANDVTDDGVVVGGHYGSIGSFGFVFEFASQRYLHQLPPLAGAGLCEITGINSSGTVCGTRTIAGPPDYPTNAFVWSEKDGFTDLGLVNGFSTYAIDIANDGTVAGEMGSTSAIAVPFVWDRVGVVEGPTLAGFQTRPQSIGHDGTVVGWAAITPGFGPQTRAFAWSGGAMTNLGTLVGFDRSTALDLNATTIVGNASSSTTAARTAVIWIDRRIARLADLVEPPGFVLDSATAISTEGNIAAVASLSGDVVTIVLHPRMVTGDIDGDCIVNIEDLLNVIGAWGPHTGSPTPADINADGVVDVLDLLIVIDSWTL